MRNYIWLLYVTSMLKRAKAQHLPRECRRTWKLVSGPLSREIPILIVPSSEFRAPSSPIFKYLLN